MSVITDPAIEQRIEREMARGIYREPADVTPDEARAMLAKDRAARLAAKELLAVKVG